MAMSIVEQCNFFFESTMSILEQYKLYLEGAFESAQATELPIADSDFGFRIGN